jgi:hypothetical protein
VAGISSTEWRHTFVLKRIGKVAATPPPDICAFGDLFPIVFGQADRPFQ